MGQEEGIGDVVFSSRFPDTAVWIKAAWLL